MKTHASRTFIDGTKPTWAERVEAYMPSLTNLVCFAAGTGFGFVIGAAFGVLS